VVQVIPTIRKSPRREHPLAQLDEDDLDFILHFVLASGSLKDMAQLYGVSYPTIRASLDRVIVQLRQRSGQGGRDEMTELLAGLVERGEIKPAAAKTIRALNRSLVERADQREEHR